MNKREHLINGLLLSLGISSLVQPSLGIHTWETFGRVGVPILLGVLLPDADTAFGSHRKTLHNLPVLGFFVVYPIFFDNLYFVWIGILSHYILDLLGTVRGMALFYPYPTEYDIPIGVPVGSKWAGLVTIVVTGGELWVTLLLMESAYFQVLFPLLTRLTGL